MANRYHSLNTQESNPTGIGKERQCPCFHRPLFSEYPNIRSDIFLKIPYSPLPLQLKKQSIRVFFPQTLNVILKYQPDKNRMKGSLSPTFWPAYTLPPQFPSPMPLWLLYWTQSFSRDSDNTVLSHLFSIIFPPWRGGQLVVRIRQWWTRENIIRLGIRIFSPNCPSN